MNAMDHSLLLSTMDVCRPFSSNDDHERLSQFEARPKRFFHFSIFAQIVFQSMNRTNNKHVHVRRTQVCDKYYCDVSNETQTLPTAIESY